jgi:hypothetical protein
MIGKCPAPNGMTRTSNGGGVDVGYGNRGDAGSRLPGLIRRGPATVGGRMRQHGTEHR